MGVFYLVGGQTTAKNEFTLSSLHIRPFIEYSAGASLLKCCKGGEPYTPPGGKRGSIRGFSDASRVRLMRLIACIDRDAPLPAFGTLTYPFIFPEPEKSKRDINTFARRFKRQFQQGGFIWKLEPQERGAPHFHLLIWNCEILQLMNWLPVAWYEIAGGGDPKHLAWHRGLFGNGNIHCVQQVRSFKGVWFYAAKYLGKTFEAAQWGSKWTGRYWGVLAKENVPFGETITMEADYSKVVKVMRMGRRFAGITKHKARRSQTIYCDADQWIDKLLLSSEGKPAGVSGQSYAGEISERQALRPTISAIVTSVEKPEPAAG